MRVFVGALIVLAAMLGSAPGHAQQRVVTVATPDAVLSRLARDLGRAFEAQTGIAVEVTTAPPDQAANGSAEALLVPRRSAPDAAEQQSVFFGEGVLVGSRADRARVRGLRDVAKALRWIASTRALYVASSPSLGLRDLELELWDQLGVNVRTRTTWYTEVKGDEADVFAQAARFGAYALIQRATLLAQDDRRGLEVLVAGDPALRTAYASVLLQPRSPEAQAWHEWLSSEQGQAAIAAWTLNGVQVFEPASGAGEGATPPRT